MGFSPWAILAIVLTGVAVCALLSVHQWRIRVDRRQNPPPAANTDEKTADNQTAQPPSDLGESGHGPGPGAAAAAAAPPGQTPSRPSAVSSSSGADNADKASRSGGCSSTVDDERRHADS